MNILINTGIFAMVITALIGAPAHAAGGGQAVAPSPTEARFTSLDRDDNDALSLDEYAAEARAGFDEMDTDHNGNITVAEMDTAAPQADGEMSSAQKIALHDDNEDSVFSRDEHQAWVEQQFEELDTNDNDSIELDELKSGVPVRVPTY